MEEQVCIDEEYHVRGDIVSHQHVWKGRSMEEQVCIDEDIMSIAMH